MDEHNVVSEMFITPGIYERRVLEDAVRESQHGDVLVHYHPSRALCEPKCKRFRKGEELKI
jgi:hypothetical protein